ncbi:MAG: sodium:calcium antiporter, partial [Desulfohalobiaceae bacterium]
FSGVFLLALLAGYIIFLFFKGKTFSLDENDHREATLRDYPKLVLGFAAITLGGNLLVEGARDIALALGASEWIIGLTIVAGGTSLPELVTCLAASIRGKNDMLLGNLIGSNFFNIAGVLGLTCLLHPLIVSPEALTGLFFLLAHLLVVLIFLRTGWRISRLEGGLLIAVNLGYWVLDATIY